MKYFTFPSAKIIETRTAQTKFYSLSTNGTPCARSRSGLYCVTENQRLAKRRPEREMAEIWDLYDAAGRRAGTTMKRGDPVPRGFYTLSVSVWLTNGRGEYLLSKRHPAKKFPNFWECTGGGVLAGEDSLTAGVREVREELGIVLAPEEGRLIYRTRRDDFQDFYDVWLFRRDAPLSSLVLQPEEVTAARWASREEIRQLRAAGELHPLLDYIDGVII